MKYSARTRRTMVKCFKLALANLPDVLVQPHDQPHRSPYICDIINRTTGYHRSSDVVTNFIADRIEHKFSIETWLKDQSEEVADAVRCDVAYNNGRKLQAYRKAWLKSLIAEFEAA